MAKVHYRKARKDYPEKGIKKGDQYYFAQIKTGPRSSRTIRQLEPIKRSQLTSSEFLSTAYSIEEQFDGLTHDEGLPDALRDIAQQITDLGEETQSRFDNMPDGLQQGDTGQMLEERASNCEEWASGVEQAADDLETKIEEINNKEPSDLDEFADVDFDDEDQVPSEDEIESARLGELASAYDEAISEASGASPGF